MARQEELTPEDRQSYLQAIQVLQARLLGYTLEECEISAGIEGNRQGRKAKHLEDFIRGAVYKDREGKSINIGKWGNV